MVSVPGAGRRRFLLTPTVPSLLRDPRPLGTIDHPLVPPPPVPPPTRSAAGCAPTVSAPPRLALHPGPVLVPTGSDP